MFEKDKGRSQIRISEAFIPIFLGLCILFGLCAATSCSATTFPKPGTEIDDLAHFSTPGFPPTADDTSAQILPTLEAPPSPTAVSTSIPIQTPVPLPNLDNPAIQGFIEEAANWNAELVVIDNENTGIWQFPQNSFAHPIALEIGNDKAFLLDAGRVIEIDLDNNHNSKVLLEPGAAIDSVRVLEPLDLSLSADSLLVLDRAGDVYRYDLNSMLWQIDRYNRPVEESSGHYFVALDEITNDEQGIEPIEQRALLETNYMYAMLYGADTTPLWNLPEGRAVDLTVIKGDVYVLLRAIHETNGTLLKYHDTGLIKTFNPIIDIDRPLQIVATNSALFILDNDGHRLRAVDLENGNPIKIYQLPQEDPVSTFAVTKDQQLILASQDKLFFYEFPEQVALVESQLNENEFQPHDPHFLATLKSYSVPIGGSNITFRDFQLPGAPRHYRLGVHQGIDFYWQPGTDVLAVADGAVIRADNEYIAPTALQLSTWWNESQERGYTSEETLDKYLGRQVWIEHEDGLVSRYAHLRSIEAGINPGTRVLQGQIIGEVGNSGSPSSLESDKADAHLHFELWMGDNYLGQYLRPIEIREWVERILTNHR